MIIKTNKFKDICTTILTAIDNTEVSTLTETLELKTSGKILYLNTTNGEYYTSVQFPIDNEEEFHATVNANLFLKLITAITTEDIELQVHSNYMTVKGNGTYKLPMIFTDNKLLVLPKIMINNPTVKMQISGNILESIMNYNSKELLRGTVSKPVQKMFYVDEKGCITFTSGACVNNFSLEKPIKILLNSRLVRLFKLFKKDMVKFTLGYDAINEDLVQTKVSFESDTITLTAIIGCNDELLNSVPINAIRNRASGVYNYNIVLNKNELLAAVNRLLLFSAGYGTAKNLKPYSLFECSQNTLTLYDSTKENKETMIFKNEVVLAKSYEMTLDLYDLKLVLDTITEEFIELSFGNHQAVVLKRPNISNVIPEVQLVYGN